MKGKQKTTIELGPDEIKAIIQKYFVENKDILIQDVTFEVGMSYHDRMDTHGTAEFTGVKCVREDDIEI